MPPFTIVINFIIVNNLFSLINTLPIQINYFSKKSLLIRNNTIIIVFCFLFFNNIFLQKTVVTQYFVIE